MLGFVNDARKRSLATEARTVYTAVQAYATECFGKGKSDEDVEDEIVGGVNSEHNLLQRDVTSVISKIRVENGKVKSFSYIKDNIKADYSIDYDIDFIVLKSTAFADGQTEKNKRVS